MPDSFATPWTIAYQAPLSIGFSRQEYCSGLPFPSPGDLPDPGIELGSPALQADSLPSEPAIILVTQFCLIFCDPMDCSMPGFPVRHQLLMFTQTLAHRVGDAIQVSHPLLSPSPPTFNLPQHKSLF